MSAFDLLSPALQYQIVNALGFRDLRAVQAAAIPPILDGHNCVVLAPTAGGKTEAAFFPLLSAMDTDDWRPVSVVYVSPIRALLNNQEPRLTQLCGLLGRRVFRWHGDTPTGERRAFAGDPADVLLTTPESLEVMLMSARWPARRLFRDLRAVVVDEVHAFVGDDRGGHLAAVLERLVRLCGQDVQRIGLSATVGNPADIVAWLGGSSKRPGVVIDPGGESAAPRLALDFVGSEANAAHVIAHLHPGTKRLVFADSRRAVEAIGKALRDGDAAVHVVHSSLAAEERRAAERAFAEGENCVIVATSALELGIDIGDLDHVYQLNAPRTVASFLQRMGRTGRRPGTIRNCTFLCAEADALVQAAALLRLHASGWVEPVRPVRAAAHLLAHQLMALAIQEGGVPESDWWAWVAGAAPFDGLSDDDRRTLVDHMLGEGILARDGGRFALGPRGERLYGRANFRELYAVFSGTRIFTVLWGTREVGTLEADFVAQTELAQLTFTLGARGWRAMSVDWDHGVLHAEPIPQSRHARWQGQPALMHRALAQAIRQVLLSEDEDPWWSRRAREHIALARQEHAFLGSGTTLVAEPDGFRFWNFAGGRANNLLARVLEERLGQRVTAGNLALGFRETAGHSQAAIQEALAELRSHGRPNDADAVRLAPGAARVRLTKFRPCLPDALEAAYVAATVMDVGEAQEGLA